MRLRYLREAREDLRVVVRYYKSQRPGLGEEFREEVRLTIRRIEGNPEGCHALKGDLRRGRTKRFPYVVIYRYRDDEVIIAAVTHARRSPDHWRDRL